MCDTPFYNGGIAVGCGRCPPCRKKRIDGWCFRMVQESKVARSAYFVTLTYDTRNVPLTKNGFMSLSKTDFQKFMKRLRKHSKSKIKYYAVGEYGNKTDRPHYHAIIFNVDSVDSIADSWSIDGFSIGAVHIGSVNSDSVAYTVKYINKPPWKPKHSRDDRLKPFSLMSKGLGSSYLSDDILKYHQADLSRMYVVREGGHKSSMPRYYRNRIFTEEQMIKQRELAAEVSALRNSELYKSYIQMYPNGELDWLKYKEAVVYGRYDRFIKNSNKEEMI